MKKITFLLAVVFCLTYVNAQFTTPWPIEKANQWYAQQGWLTGCNYLPATAINQLEMFQANTFDTVTMHKELALAKSIGFNTLRVFLHDKLWDQDAKGFKARLNIFLRICSRYGIKPMLVFFDSCWDPFPKPGPQHKPVSGLHNPGWVQSPGADILKDSTQWNRLEKYVKDIVRTFGKDRRILCWDVWNEPDNANGSSYNIFEPLDKTALVEKLLPKVFEWARSQRPEQPLTSGLFQNHTAWPKDQLSKRGKVEQIQLDNSDIITFHNYSETASFEKDVLSLQSYQRPIICTEYMARGNNSTVINIMPLGKQYNVGMINWGFVDGKEQTKFPWDSWKSRYTSDPPLWHHVLFHADLTPYKTEEIDLIKSLRKASDK